jgi:hypothetical protein
MLPGGKNGRDDGERPEAELPERTGSRHGSKHAIGE